MIIKCEIKDCQELSIKVKCANFPVVFETEKVFSLASIPNLISFVWKQPNFFPDEFVDLRFGVAQPIHLLKEYPCKLKSVPGDYHKIGNGMLFQKDWPYTNLINYHLYNVRMYFKSYHLL